MDKILTNIKDRVLQIADLKGFSKEIFFEELGLKYSNFKGIAKKSSLSADSLVKILTKYDDISPDWLLFGRGHIYRNGQNSQYQSQNFVLNEPTVKYEDKTREIKLLEETIELQKFKISVLEAKVTEYENDGRIKEKGKDYSIYIGK